MRKLRAPLALLCFCLLAGLRFARAQETPQQPTLDIQARTEVSYSPTNGLMTITNGVLVKYTDASGLMVLTADRASINQKTGDIFAEGGVHIQKDNETWAGEKLHYNYQTKIMEGDKFRMGKSPVFVQGENLHGSGTSATENGLYQGTNALITTRMIITNRCKECARSDSPLCPGSISRRIMPLCTLARCRYFIFPITGTACCRSKMVSRFCRGIAACTGRICCPPTIGFSMKLFAGRCMRITASSAGSGWDRMWIMTLANGSEERVQILLCPRPQASGHGPGHRQRRFRAIVTGFISSYSAEPGDEPYRHLSQVAYQSDPFIVRDFFESQYKKDIQPNTFVDVSQFWQNWSLDALAQPRLNPYWETVERLPDVRLTGFRQQIANTPVYYESQSSVGYFRRLFADTNNFGNPLLIQQDYSGSREDTFHQLTLPQNYFGWLNVTPRAGGRFTYYDSTSGPGATTTNHSRTVLNTGVEASFTVSRTWAGVHNDFFEMDGLRHIFQPSVNYVYIPQPSTLPSQLPQFDYQPTNSLRQLPIDFPDYNSIDSINSENTIRYTINNRLQTKRNGELDDLLNWNVSTDWHLRPRTDETTFSDIYSDLSFKPKKWLKFNSFTRYSIEQSQFNFCRNTASRLETEQHLELDGRASFILRSGPIFRGKWG